MREAGHAATVAEISKRAGLDTRAFYRLFRDKQHALAAAREHLFRHMMAVTAAAFITAESWPQRVWEALRAFVACLEHNPTLAHLTLVDSQSAAPRAVDRIDEMALAFTIFLEEGFRYEPKDACPSDLALQAIAASVVELGYQHSRDSTHLRLSGLLPHLGFIALAPFLGANATNEFLDAQGYVDHRVNPISEAAAIRRVA